MSALIRSSPIIARTTIFVATHGRGVWKMPIPADTNPLPTVAAISPLFGSPAGGTSVTITGTNFLANPSVYFDGVAATNAVQVNGTTITATTPAHASGGVDVVVVNADNRGATLKNGYTFGTPNVLPSGDTQGGPSGSPNVLPSGGSHPAGPNLGTTPVNIPNPRKSPG